MVGVIFSAVVLFLLLIGVIALLRFFVKMAFDGAIGIVCEARERLLRDELRVRIMVEKQRRLGKNMRKDDSSFSRLEKQVNSILQQKGF